MPLISLRDNIREISFSTLPGMKAEVDTIFRFMPHAEHTYQLSEEYLKHNCGKYGGMHISTHGYTLHLDDDKGNYILRLYLGRQIAARFPARSVRCQ